jgi:DNA repair exonuclease SbcCD ATPase subunit
MKLSKGKIAKLYNKKHQSRRRNKKMARIRRTFRNTKIPLNLATKTLKMRGGKRVENLKKILSPITSGVKSLQNTVVASAKTGVKNAIQFFTTQSKNFYDKAQTDYYDKLLFGFKTFYMSEINAWTKINDLSNITDLKGDNFLQGLTKKRIDKYNEKMTIKSVFEFYEIYKKEVKEKLVDLEYKELKEILQELEKKVDVFKPLFEKDAKYLTDLFYEKKFGLNVDTQKLEYLSDGQKVELFKNVADDVTKNKIELDKIHDSGQDSVKKYEEKMKDIGEIGELPEDFKGYVFLQKVYGVTDAGNSEKSNDVTKNTDSVDIQNPIDNSTDNTDSGNSKDSNDVIDKLNNNLEIENNNSTDNKNEVDNKGCPSKDIEPKEVTTKKEYHDQSLIFHPDNNKDCKDESTTKMARLNNLWEEFKKDPEHKKLEITEIIKDTLKTEIIKQQIKFYFEIGKQIQDQENDNRFKEIEGEFETQNDIFEKSQILIDKLTIDNQIINTLETEMDNLIDSHIKSNTSEIFINNTEDNQSAIINKINENIDQIINRFNKEVNEGNKLNFKETKEIILKNLKYSRIYGLHFKLPLPPPPPTPEENSTTTQVTPVTPPVPAVISNANPEPKTIIKETSTTNTQLTKEEQKFKKELEELETSIFEFKKIGLNMLLFICENVESNTIQKKIWDFLLKIFSNKKYNKNKENLKTNLIEQKNKFNELFETTNKKILEINNQIKQNNNDYNFAIQDELIKLDYRIQNLQTFFLIEIDKLIKYKGTGNKTTEDYKNQITGELNLIKNPHVEHRSKVFPDYVGGGSSYDNYFKIINDYADQMKSYDEIQNLRDNLNNYKGKINEGTYKYIEYALYNLENAFYRIHLGKLTTEQRNYIDTLEFKTKEFFFFHIINNNSYEPKPIEFLNKMMNNTNRTIIEVLNKMKTEQKRLGNNNINNNLVSKINTTIDLAEKALDENPTIPVANAVGSNAVGSNAVGSNAVSVATGSVATGSVATGSVATGSYNAISSNAVTSKPQTINNYDEMKEEIANKILSKIGYQENVQTDPKYFKGAFDSVMKLRGVSDVVQNAVAKNVTEQQEVKKHLVHTPVPDVIKTFEPDKQDPEIQTRLKTIETTLNKMNSKIHNLSPENKKTCQELINELKEQLKEQQKGVKDVGETQIVPFKQPIEDENNQIAEELARIKREKTELEERVKKIEEEKRDGDTVLNEKLKAQQKLLEEKGTELENQKKQLEEQVEKEKLEAEKQQQQLELQKQQLKEEKQQMNEQHQKDLEELTKKMQETSAEEREKKIKEMEENHTAELTKKENEIQELNLKQKNYEDMEKQINGLNQQILDQTKNIEALNNKNTEIQQKLLTAGVNENEKNELFNAQKDNLEEIKQLNKQLELSKTELENAKNSLIEITSENANLTNKITDLTNKITDLEKERGELTSKITELENERGELEKQKGELTNEKEKFEKEKEDLKTQLKSKNTEYEEKMEKSVNLNSEEKRKATDELEKIKADLKNKEAELTAKEAELTAKEEELKKANANIDKNKQELNTKEEELTAKTEELTAKTGQLEQTKQTLDETNIELEKQKENNKVEIKEDVEIDYILNGIMSSLIPKGSTSDVDVEKIENTDLLTDISNNITIKIADCVYKSTTTDLGKLKKDMTEFVELVNKVIYGSPTLLMLNTLTFDEYNKLRNTIDVSIDVSNDDEAKTQHKELYNYMESFMKFIMIDITQINEFKKEFEQNTTRLISGVNGGFVLVTIKTKNTYDPVNYISTLFYKEPDGVRAKFCINNKYIQIPDLQKNDDTTGIYKENITILHILELVDFFVEIIKKDEQSFKNLFADINGPLYNFIYSFMYGRIELLNVLINAANALKCDNNKCLNTKSFKNQISTIIDERNPVATYLILNNKGEGTDYNKSRFDLKTDGDFRYLQLDYNGEEKESKNPKEKENIYNKRFVFGKFDKIFGLKRKDNNNVITNQDIANNMMKIQKQLLTGNPVFVIGYGQSGAGKTSTLINLNKDGKSNPGVLVYLCNSFGNNYPNIELITQEFYNSSNKTVGVCDDINSNNDICKKQTFNFVFDNGQFIIGNNVDKKRKFKYRQPALDATPQITNTESNVDHADVGFLGSATMGDVLKYLIDTDRFVKPTTNNPDSSRSHSLIYIKMKTVSTTSKQKQEQKQLHLIIGDFAGVENKFNCGEKEVLNKFLKLNQDRSDDSQYVPRNPIGIDPSFNLTYIENKNKVSQKKEEDYDLKDEYKKSVDDVIKTLKNDGLTYNNRIIEGTDDEENKKILNDILASLNDNVKTINEKVKEIEEIILTGETSINKQQKDTLIKNDTTLQDIMKTKSNIKNNTNDLNKENNKLKYDIYENIKTIIFSVVYGKIYAKYSKYIDSKKGGTKKKYIIKNKTKKKKNIQRGGGDPQNDFNNSLFKLSNYIIENSGKKDFSVKEFKDIIVESKFDVEIIKNGLTDFNRSGFITSKKEYLIKRITNIKILENLQIFVLGLNYSSPVSPKLSKEENAKSEFVNEIQNQKKLITEIYKNTPMEILIDIKQNNDKWNITMIMFAVEIILRKTTYFEDKYETAVQVMNYGKDICEERVIEGIFINESLKELRETIFDIMIRKTEKMIYYSPSFNYNCLPDLCPSTRNCFKIKKKDNQEDKVEEPKSLILRWIFENYNPKNNNENKQQKYDPKKYDDFCSKILIGLFCVFNISTTANNPPPTTYIDINELKKHWNNMIDTQYNDSLFEKQYPALENLIEKVKETTKDLKNIDDSVKQFIEKMTVIRSTNMQNTDFIKQINDFIDTIEKSNSTTAIGTLEYLDSFAKLNTTNTVCASNDANTNYGVSSTDIISQDLV